MQQVQTAAEHFAPNVDAELNERIAARTGMPAEAIHYLVGAGAGAAYGALGGRHRAGGLLFGAAVWAASAATWRTNWASFGAHLVYGVVTDGVRRCLEG